MRSTCPAELSAVSASSSGSVKSKRLHSIAARILIAFGLVLGAAPTSLLFAQDVLTVGGQSCVSATPGSVVHIPVYVQDISGTTLGVDQTAGKKIQSISFSITPNPASGIALDTAGKLTANTTPSGITAGLGSPIFLNQPRTGAAFGYVVLYDEASQPIPFRSNAAARGDLIADIALTLNSTAAIGTPISLAINPSSTVTALGNAAGTLAETVGNSLSTVGGCVNVVKESVSLACPFTTVVSGSTGTGTVSIGSPNSAAVNVVLSSSATAVATVPASVTIPAGQISASFTVTGVSAGSATITATLPSNLGGNTATCTTTIANPTATVALFCPSTSVVRGSTGTATVSINPAQPSSTTLSLTSGNASVATVPASVSIPAGQTSATFTVTGVGAGSATITATLPANLGGSAATCTTTVVNPPATVALSCPSTSVVRGSTGTITVSINPSQSSSTTVSLTSGNPSVATVPASVSIPAGQTSVTFDVTGVAAGSATITATLPSGAGGASASCTTTVVNPNVTIALSCPTGGVITGMSGTATITIGTSQPSPITVNVSSSNPAIASVPSSVSIPAGQTSVTFQVTGVAAGSATITATMPSSLGGASVSCTTSVIALVTIALTCPAADILVGTTASASVSIGTAQASTTTVTLSSSNQNIATVPSSVTIPAGQKSATFQTTGVGAGNATITATMPGALGASSTTCTTRVVKPTALSLACPGKNVVVGSGGTGTVIIGNAQSSASTVILSSSNPAVATVPTSVSIPAGQTSVTFVVTGVAAGTATITATLQSGTVTTATCTTTVVNPPVRLTLQCPSANIVTGTTGATTVSISDKQSSPTTIALTSLNSNVAAVPAGVVIAAGQTSATFQITGVGAGNAVILVSVPNDLGGASGSCTVTVINPTISLAPAAPAVAVGGSTEETITISAAMATATSITLTSSNTSAATVPASVSIPAGAKSATFDITGVAAGFASVKAILPAALGGETATAQVTVSSKIAYFTGKPTTISLGQTATLSWSTVGSNSVSIDNQVGAQAATGSLTVRPTTDTTYKLTTVGGGTPETAEVKIEVIASPVIVISRYPSGMVQPANTNGATDSYVLSNIGGASGTISLGQTVSKPSASTPFFFTQSPSSFTLGKGENQVVEIVALAVPAEFYEGTSTISLNGVSSGLSVPVRLASAASPIGTVDPKPDKHQIFTSSEPSSDPQGSVLFKNHGTATLKGIVSSDVEWIIPEPGIITIDPGQSRAVTFTIKRAKRPDGSDPFGSLEAKFSLVYAGRPPTTNQLVQVNDTGTAVSTSSVSVVDSPKPPVSTASIPALPAGQVAFFVPGVQHVGGLASAFVLQHRVPKGLPRDLGLFYTAAVAQSASASQFANLSSAPPSSALAFGDVVRTVFGNESQAGTLQVRTTDFDKISVHGNLMNVSNPQGFYGTTLVSMRSDRGVPPAASTYLVGLRKDTTSHTDLYIQEVSGGGANVTTEFFDEKGVSLGSRSDTASAFGLLQFANAVPQGAVVATVTNDSKSAGSVIARALITDETTGAPTDIVDWRLRNAISSTDPMLIPIVATKHSSLVETHTEVTITNTGTTPASGVLSFPTTTSRHRAVRTAAPASGTSTAVDEWVAEPSGTAEITLEPNQSKRFSDVLASLGITSDTSSYLVFTPSSGNVAISTQLRSSNSRGTFATSIPTISSAAGLALSQTRDFAQVEDAAPASTAAGKGFTLQSGFGLVEAAGKSATVRVTLQFTATGSGSTTTSLRATVSKDYALSAKQSLSFTASEFIGPSRDTLGDLHNMQVSFTTISGDGSVVPYVISTDNGTGNAMVRLE